MALVSVTPASAMSDIGSMLPRPVTVGHNAVHDTLNILTVSFCRPTLYVLNNINVNINLLFPNRLYILCSADISTNKGSNHSVAR